MRLDGDAARGEVVVGWEMVLEDGGSFEVRERRGEGGREANDRDGGG